jgi:hypothetical protein
MGYVGKIIISPADQVRDPDNVFQTVHGDMSAPDTGIPASE